MDDLNVYLDELQKHDRFSGVVLVGEVDRVIYTKATGLAHRGYGIPNTIKTRFNFASVGKMFTALAIGQLIENGKLAFTDTVSRFLPELADSIPTDRITIEHLLLHTSGLGDFMNEDFYRTPRDKFKTVQDFLRLIKKDTLLFAPGKQWSYSNTGYLLLGAIVERVSGVSFYDYIRDHIFVPAGMKDSDYFEADIDIPDMAIGYTYRYPWNNRGNTILHNNMFEKSVKGSPAGGGYASALDLFKFINALASEKIIKNALLAEMVKGRYPRLAFDTLNKSVAYGFDVENAYGFTNYGHGGAAPGVNAEVRYYPAPRHTIIVLSNLDPPSATNVWLRIERMITGQLYKPVVLKERELERFVGTYASVESKDAKVYIRKENDVLKFQASRRNIRTMVPLSGSIFLDEQKENITFYFTKNRNGEVETLKMVGVGPVLNAVKVKE